VTSRSLKFYEFELANGPDAEAMGMHSPAHEARMWVSMIQGLNIPYMNRVESTLKEADGWFNPDGQDGYCAIIAETTIRLTEQIATEEELDLLIAAKNYDRAAL
jgi:hypothetical protein